MDVFGTFLDWAWERHHNLLSWYIRPLFILPYCWFAWRRSLTGVLLTIVALLTSMFWFPKPEVVDSRAEAFLAMELEYLTGAWGFWKVAMSLSVPLFFVALAWAFWRRSWVLGLVVVNLVALGKVVWSFAYGDADAWSLLPPALIGLAVCNVVLVWAWRRTRKRG